MTRYHLINGERVAFTAEEETARDKEEAAWKTEQAAKEYIGKRRESYPSIPEQLDLLYKDIVAGKMDATGSWATRIKAVKDANPKP